MAPRHSPVVWTVGWACVIAACGETSPDASRASTGVVLVMRPAFACASRVGGQPSCWGTESAIVNPSTGLDHLEPAAGPTPIPGVTGVVEIAAIGSRYGGDGRVCVRTSDGAIDCWGYNGLGASDWSSHEPVTLPSRVAGIGPARRVALLDANTCALMLDGTVVCWGNTFRFDNPPQPGPTTLPGLANVSDLSVGSASHACAITDGGTVSCWGDNYYGQLGAGDRSVHEGPVAVRGVSGARTVVVDGDHSSALLEDGRVLCWGDCGPGDALVPTEIENMRGTTDLGTGVNFGNCVATPSGKVRCACMATYFDGWDGVFDPPCDFAFRTVDGIDDVAMVRTVPKAWFGARTTTACAVRLDDTVWCWGGDAEGLLGDGVTVTDGGTTGAPVKVPLPW